MDENLSEEWRVVPGFGQKYEVSSFGRVRVIATGQVKATRLNHRGYPTLTLYHEGRHSKPVHQLVAFAFIGPRPQGMDVRHLDGVKDHNFPSNLAYGTRAQNMADSVRLGLTRNAHSGKTHCIRGHEFTDENTWLHAPSNKRACKECNWLRRQAKRRGLPFPKPPTPKNPKREDSDAR